VTLRGNCLYSLFSYFDATFSKPRTSSLPDHTAVGDGEFGGRNGIPPGMEPVAGLGFMPGAVNRAFNTYFNKRTTSGKRCNRTQYDRSNVYRKRRMPYS